MQLSSRNIKRILRKKNLSVRERGTFLSIEILFGLLEYACFPGVDLQGLFSLGQCRGYLHLPVMSSKKKRVEVEERGKKTCKKRQEKRVVKLS